VHLGTLSSPNPPRTVPSAPIHSDAFGDAKLWNTNVATAWGAADAAAVT
jgi:hypothetical protein